MAEEVLRRVEDQLKCSHCSNTYCNPRLLHCFHAFCQECLVALMVQDKPRQVTCPSCSKVTQITVNGVAGLQAASQINHLLEIMEEHKKEADIHKKTKVDATTTTTTTTEEEVSGFCQDHVKEELKLYCETCEQFTCLHCILKTGKHYGHSYELLDEAFDKCEKTIGSLDGGVSKDLMELKESNGALFLQQTNIETEIRRTFRELRKALDSRETEVIDRLHQLTQSKLKGLAAKRVEVKAIQAQLSGFSNHLGRRDTEGERVIKQVKELSATIHQNGTASGSEYEASIVFSASSKTFTLLCQKFRRLLAVHLQRPSPSSCRKHTTHKGQDPSSQEKVPPSPVPLFSSEDDDDALFAAKKVVPPAPPAVNGLFSTEDFDPHSQTIPPTGSNNNDPFSSSQRPYGRQATSEDHFTHGSSTGPNGSADEDEDVSPLRPRAKTAPATASGVVSSSLSRGRTVPCSTTRSFCGGKSITPTPSANQVFNFTDSNDDLVPQGKTASSTVTAAYSALFSSDDDDLFSTSGGSVSYTKTAPPTVSTTGSHESLSSDDELFLSDSFSHGGKTLPTAKARPNISLTSEGARDRSFSIGQMKTALPKLWVIDDETMDI